MTDPILSQVRVDLRDKLVEYDSDRYEIWVTYLGPNEGWIMKKTKLYSPDIEYFMENIREVLAKGVNLIVENYRRDRQDEFNQRDSEDPDDFVFVQTTDSDNISILAQDGLWFEGRPNGVRVELENETVAEDSIDRKYHRVVLDLDSDVHIKRNLRIGHDLDIGDDVWVHGSLFVEGASTRIDTKVLQALDPIVVINTKQEYSPGQVPATDSDDKDSGFIFQRFSLPNADDYNVALGWDEDVNAFKLGETDTHGYDSDNVEINWTDDYAEFRKKGTRLNGVEPNRIVFTDSEGYMKTHNALEFS